MGKEGADIHMGGDQTSPISARAGQIAEGGIFAALASKQTYLNFAYLLLSFPLGIFYFVLLVVGLSLGVGLSIIGIGLLILLAVLVAMRSLANWERLLGIWLLGAHIPPPAPRPEPWEHPLIALRRYLTDSYTWKSLIYFVVKFPLAIATFVITIFLVSFTLALVSAPLFYRYAPVNLFFWHVTRAEEALICAAIGLILGLISVHIFNGIAWLWRAFVTAMLKGTDTQGNLVRTGPIVIP
jgi:lysylphosphatidylglycerol synthetase-like protein (DUF2156 family)